MARRGLGASTNHPGPASAAALTFTLLASLATPARAEYCRTKTCDNHLSYDDVWQTEPDPPCDSDENGCRLEGQTIYWPKSCLTFSVQEDGSKKLGIDYSTLHEVIEQAFATWMSAECPGGGPPALRVDDLSPAVCNHPEYNQDQGNANVFMFRDGDWPHADPYATLALTTITYNRENAQIFDADVEINSFMQTFTTPDNPSPGGFGFDLLSVLTHETGHFLGLSHDSDRLAAMWKQYDPGQQFLYESDVRGICDIFPPDQPLSEHACSPPHGFQRTCAVAKSKGCAISTERPSGAWSLGLFAVGGLGVALRRVRRGARHR